MMYNSNFSKNEKGMALIFVTITLTLSMLVIGPLLGFIGGAGRSAQIREDRMHQVYAADMGIEDGYYRIISPDFELPESPDTDPLFIGLDDVNGSDVVIEIYKEEPHPVYGDRVYSITSTATDYRGTSATIESYVAEWDYSSLLDYALIGADDIEISSNTVITGNVALNGDLRNDNGYIDGEVVLGVIQWPSSDVLSSMYNGQVEGPCGHKTILVKEQGAEKAIGKCKTKGDQKIKGKGSITLDGTVYIAGDLDFEPSPSLLIKLNGNTIYSEGSINVGTDCTVIGPGCIIAARDLFFSPQISGDGYILAMSAEGDVTAQPNGTFYGTIAGCSRIDIQPHSAVTWIEYPDDLNFPMGDNVLPQIISYMIN